MKPRSIYALTLLLVLSCQFTYSQESIDMSFSLLTLPEEGNIRQAWAVPDRAGIDKQEIADRHLPAQYIFELEIFLNPPKNLGLRQLTLREIVGHASIVSLDFSGCKITDDDLRELKLLPNLQTLVLDHTMVSGTGLKQLTACRSLRFLSLHDAPKIYETSHNVTEETNLIELAPASYFLTESLPGLVLVTGSGDTVVTMNSRKPDGTKD
ncbi:MAG: hypothetical protein KDB03_25975 [Planctomycetales bacterium]|nr:hypothetical protein [Planctomycetales bacterium]